jgi:hypothetical protein
LFTLQLPEFPSERLEKADGLTNAGMPSSSPIQDPGSGGGGEGAKMIGMAEISAIRESLGLGSSRGDRLVEV